MTPNDLRELRRLLMCLVVWRSQDTVVISAEAVVDRVGEILTEMEEGRV